MSRYIYFNLKCEECGKENKIKVWDSINVTIDRKYKKTILDDTFFKFQCSKCGHIGLLNYECLYNDVEKKLMMYMIPNCDEKQFEEVNKRLKDILRNDPLDYRFAKVDLRVVSNLDELKEKINIKDYNYDDRIMELLKMYYRALFYQESPEKEIERSYFEVREGHAKLTFYLNNAKAFSIPFDESVYHKIERIYRKAVNKVELEGFQIINYDWVESAIFNTEY